jgi:hypothetical protein
MVSVMWQAIWGVSIRARQVREGLRRVIAVLPCEAAIVDRAAVEPRRRAVLSRPKVKPAACKRSASAVDGRLDGVRRDIGWNAILLSPRASRRES